MSIKRLKNTGINHGYKTKLYVPNSVNLIEMLFTKHISTLTLLK